MFYVKLKSNCIIFTVKPTRCTNGSNCFILNCHCTFFGRSFRPSSGVQDCAYSNRHMSNRHCCLLRQQCLFDKCLLLYAQSWTPDDGRKDRPKHVEWHFKIIDTLVHLVGFTIEINCDARPYERQIRTVSVLSKTVHMQNNTSKRRDMTV